MPCFCYGAVTGQEAFDDFVKTENGKKTLQAIETVVVLIKTADLPSECMPYQIIEFRQMFVKGFMHMLVGCDEKGRPKAQ